MTRLRALRLLYAALLLVAASCGILETGDDELTLFVAPTTAECMGIAPQRCLLVKYEPNGDWQYLYDSIIGFTFEPGFLYELLVARRRIANPPADGSSFEYRLTRLVNKTAVQ